MVRCISLQGRQLLFRPGLFFPYLVILWLDLVKLNISSICPGVGAGAVCQFLHDYFVLGAAAVFYTAPLG